MALEITGRRRNLVLALWERLYPLPGDGLLRIAGQDITIDPRHPSERLLFYFFSNVMRSYRCSGLGRLIETTLGAGDVFLDIGANLGMYSWLARRRGATAICFEPEPAHAAFLGRNAVVCDRLLPIALSDQAGEALGAIDRLKLIKIEVLGVFGYSAFVWRGSHFEPFRPSDVAQVFDLLLRRV